MATDGWQHWQTVPDGDSYTRRFGDQVAPPPLETAPYTRVPLSLRSSQAAKMRCGKMAFGLVGYSCYVAAVAPEEVSDAH